MPGADLVCTLAWPELSKTPAMRIGGSASLDVFTVAPWQKMAQDSLLGWPMIRERILALSGQILDTLQGSSARGAITGDMEARVAALAQERAQAMLQGLAR